MPLTKVQSRGTENVGQGSSNVIINGAMNVAQRGASSTGLGATSGYYTVDRYNLVVGGTDGRLTMSQDSSAPSGFANSLKLDCTTADTSIASGEFLIIRQTIEAQNCQQFAKGTSDAKQFALSFYVKGNASATYVAELVADDVSRQISQTFSVTTDWTRVEIIFPADTTGAINDDNGAGLYFNIWLHGGSDYTGGSLSTTWSSITQANRAVGISSFFDSTDRTFFLTGVQLEVGSQVSDFQHEDFGTTLRKCQRYYYLHSSGTTSFAGGGDMYTNTQLDCNIYFPVTMRSTPSLVATSGTNYYLAYGNNTTTTMTNAWNIFAPQNNCCTLYAVATSSVTAGSAMRVLANNSSASIAVDAEL